MGGNFKNKQADITDVKSTISVFLNIGYTFGSSGEVLRNTDTWALPPEILISVGCVPSIGIFVKGLSRLILHTSKNENLCTTCIQWDGSGGRTTACQLKGILSNSVKNSKIITKKVFSAFDQKDELFPQTVSKYLLVLLFLKN